MSSSWSVLTNSASVSAPRVLMRSRATAMKPVESSLNLDLNLSLPRMLRSCPRNGASLGEEAVLADSGRAGETCGLFEHPVDNPSLIPHVSLIL